MGQESKTGWLLKPRTIALGLTIAVAIPAAAFVSGYPLQRSLTKLDRGFEHYDDDFGSDWQRRTAGVASAVDRASAR